MKKAFALLMLVVVLTGCAAETRKMRLEQTLRLYENAVRWGNYGQAYALRKERDDGVPDLDYLRDVKVTSYQSLSQTVQEQGNRVDQAVEIRYYHQDYGKERVIVDHQIWRYSTDNEVWLLESEMPDFK